MEFLPLAFLLGVFGSLHCGVMCGPIMLAMPFQKQSFLKTGLQLILYQAGRILVYMVLGLIAGFIGSSIKTFSNQKTLSIIIGCLMIFFTLLQFNQYYRTHFSKLQARALKPVINLMGKVFRMPLWGLFAGMLNGLIPCGMVYLALATALSSGTIKSAVFFMLLFGLGTAPLMMMISMGGIYLKKYIHFNTNRLVPWFIWIMGVLFILRAVDLGIPFLSPNNGHAYGNTLECK